MPESKVDQETGQAAAVDPQKKDENKPAETKSSEAEETQKRIHELNEEAKKHRLEAKEWKEKSIAVEKRLADFESTVKRLAGVETDQSPEAVAAAMESKSNTLDERALELAEREKFLDFATVAAGKVVDVNDAWNALINIDEFADKIAEDSSAEKMKVYLDEFLKRKPYFVPSTQNKKDIPADGANPPGSSQQLGETLPPGQEGEDLKRLARIKGSFAKIPIR